MADPEPIGAVGRDQTLKGDIGAILHFHDLHVDRLRTQSVSVSADIAIPRFVGRIVGGQKEEGAVNRGH